MGKAYLIRNRVAVLMAERGLSSKQLAGMAGLTEQGLAKALKPGHKPFLKTIGAIAAGLGVEPSEIMLLDGTCNGNE